MALVNELVFAGDVSFISLLSGDVSAGEPYQPAPGRPTIEIEGSW